MERACQGIWAIARIVGNSANEPETTDTQPLDGWVVSNLMGGVESLCDHMADLVTSALDGLDLDFAPISASKSAH